jgi:hypothetical protein
MRVPWLEKQAIACQAERLVADYEAVTGEKVIPPIPVEDLIERFLGVSLTYENLDEKLGMSDVLGATYQQDRCATGVVN